MHNTGREGHHHSEVGVLRVAFHGHAAGRAPAVHGSHDCVPGAHHE